MQTQRPPGMMPLHMRPSLVILALGTLGVITLAALVADAVFHT